MNTNFPEQRYLWRCPLNCGFVVPRREDWDDVPGPTFCPHDGIPLERVSCPHCDAPIMWRTMQVRGNTIIDKAPWCPYCGGSTEVAEQKMRDGPKVSPPRRPRRKAKPPTDLYGDIIQLEEQDDDKL